VATSWVPVWDQTSGPPAIVATATIGADLDGWYSEEFLPMMETPMTDWLFSEIGYTPPTPPTPVYPPSSGRGWPHPGSTHF
jgi:hypothetical protein